MSAKASTLKSSIENFIHRQGIDAEMEQNLVKEAIHLHLLSAMSADSGASRTVIPAHCGQHSGDCGQFLMSV
jgi:hypothetical protein